MPNGFYHSSKYTPVPNVLLYLYNSLSTVLLFEITISTWRHSNPNYADGIPNPTLLIDIDLFPWSQPELLQLLQTTGTPMIFLSTLCPPLVQCSVLYTVYCCSYNVSMVPSYVAVHSPRELRTLDYYLGEIRFFHHG